MTMKIHLKILFSTLSCFLLVKNSLGQKQLITGKVFDEAGKPVAFASITFKDTRSGGTSTKEDGSYWTYIPQGYDTNIVCTHLNYIKKIEKVEGNNVINFILERQIPRLSTISIAGTHKYTDQEKNKLKIQSESGVERIFSPVEESASFVGGEAAFQKYLSKEIVYPDSATISKVRGIVKVNFIIGKDGFPKNITLLKGVNKFTDELVLNAISKMPKWNIARQNTMYTEQYKEVSVSFDIIGKD